MVKQQFLGSLADLGLSILAHSSSRNDGSALEGRGPAIEDEDGLGPEVQELANPAKEAKQMRVPYHLPLLVPHRLHELHHPYARICPPKIHKSNHSCARWAWEIRVRVLGTMRRYRWRAFFRLEFRRRPGGRREPEAPKVHELPFSLRFKSLTMVPWFQFLIAANMNLYKGQEVQKLVGTKPRLRRRFNPLSNVLHFFSSKNSKNFLLYFN